MTPSLKPAYYGLYNKLRLQDELVADILSEAKKKLWDDGSFSERFASAEPIPLEEASDHADITAMLKSRIQDSEIRYASLVAEILQADSKRLQDLEKVAYAFGTKHAVSVNCTPVEAYHIFYDIFLNGIPEERANILLAQSETACSWDQKMEIHEPYWTHPAADISVYYALRKKVMEGMLFDTMLSVGRTDDGHYEIRKEG